MRLRTFKFTVERFEEENKKGYQFRTDDDSNVGYAYRCWSIQEPNEYYRAVSRYWDNGEKFRFELGIFNNYEEVDNFLHKHILETASEQVNAINSADDWFQEPVDFGKGPIPMTNEQWLKIYGFKPHDERHRAKLENLVD